VTDDPVFLTVGDVLALHSDLSKGQMAALLEQLSEAWRDDD
jgi:hypothetical protein